MHDPLCFEFDNKDDDCFDHSLESPFCYCDLIKIVRDDERKKYSDNTAHLRDRIDRLIDKANRWRDESADLRYQIRNHRCKDN
jgi:hypothetical protein